VQRHGGRLTVARADGGGAQFEVRLPLPTAGAAAGAVTAREEA
jgi:signal transduction histidine kinase